MTVNSIDFSNLSGGLNTAFTNEMMADNEFSELKNIDIESKGTLKRRKGMFKHYQPSVEGKGQGFFRLFRKGRVPLEVFAINGKLYQRPIDSIETNELLDYEFDSAQEGYKIVKLKLENAKEDSVITLFEENTLTLSEVDSITEANQFVLASGELKLSLSNDDTAWVDEPTIVDMRSFFEENRFGINYETKSELIAITGLEKGFQKTRNIEATQYKEKLYIATGTKLVEFDGVSAKVVEPHKPTPLEALYIGTNALADDPDNFMTDGVANDLRIDGVTSNLKLGVINTPTILTAHISKPADITEVEYKFMYRRVGTETWTTGQDYSVSKTYSFKPDGIGDYEFDVYARKKAEVVEPPAEPQEETPVRFIVPKYTVKETDENVYLNFSAIHRCNRILLHWERLIMYGDDFNSSMIYISHLKRPEYFPTSNSLSFENKEMGQITSLLRYRDMIVAFTPNSIQALYGKSPEDYQRFTLNTGVGCIAPFSAKVVNNYVVFLSKDGVYLLDSVGITEERANVTKIDTKVENIVSKVENAVAVVDDGQYKLFFPGERKALRTYYEQNWIWTKDESEKLDISNTEEREGILYVQSDLTGAVYYFKEGHWMDDDFVYEDLIVTKEYDFGLPYIDKKIKMMKFLLSTTDRPINLFVSLVGDGNLLVNPMKSYAKVEDGEVVWVEEIMSNLRIASGSVLGTWLMGIDAFGSRDVMHYKERVSGRFKRLRLIISHKEPTSNNLISYGFMLVRGKNR